MLLCGDSFFEYSYREVLPETRPDGFGIVLHVLQALHPLQVPQHEQLPPQKLFPAFLSRIMPRIRRPVIKAMITISTMLIRFAESQVNIETHPLRGGQRCEGRVRTRTALPYGEIVVILRSASVLLYTV